jgi:hypothetical protein
VPAWLPDENVAEPPARLADRIAGMRWRFVLGQLKAVAEVPGPQSRTAEPPGR